MLPSSPDPNNNLGLVMDSMGRLSEAINSYELAQPFFAGSPLLNRQHEGLLNNALGVDDEFFNMKLRDRMRIFPHVDFSVFHRPSNISVIQSPVISTGVHCKVENRWSCPPIVVQDVPVACRL
ncbi:hypothetical protein KOR42_50840 [Thalassoglobus neptunius]|uniref:Tetratricopeptide repeat protein n=1 Tax=Thalassoglobus neptunius TaxID=1938619 RepID=A0A5C5VMW7_9PLAN|nr:hypothetical protein KOR42_50840 [Thalassoglobus neptunius]